MSIAGHQGKAKAEDGRINRGKGADQGSGTRSSLMWETIHIIEQMGKWKPKYVIWENVRNVTSRHMIANFIRYQKEMERMGYTNNYEVLDAREFGLPQARERVFTISVLGGEKFQFDELIRTPMRSIDEFLEKNEEVPEVYDVTQPSVREVIGVTGSVRRATVIEDYAFTITTRQDRTPAQQEHRQQYIHSRADKRNQRQRTGSGAHGGSESQYRRTGEQRQQRRRRRRQEAREGGKDTQEEQSGQTRQGAEAGQRET